MKNSRGGQCNNVNINRMFDLEHEDQKLRKMHCDTAVEQVHMQEHIHTISLPISNFINSLSVSSSPIYMIYLLDKGKLIWKRVVNCENIARSKQNSSLDQV